MIEEGIQWSKNMWDIMTRENISCPEIIALMRREESKCTNTFEMENGGQDAVRSFLNDAQHTASSTLSRSKDLAHGRRLKQLLSVKTP